MRTIIFEGIATSGKTSVERCLIELFEANKVSYLLVEEDKTLMPVLYNHDVLASLRLLTESIVTAYVEQRDVYIFDRLHLTHACRTESEIEKFREVEDILRTHNPVIVLLTIEESLISERVRWALANRDADWVRHARRRESDEAIFAHYREQQADLQRLIEASTLPHETITTSDLDFQGAARRIYETYCIL
ncbi:MAG: hypothetical protein Q7S84_03390 [bacterium]|nr:hypothetical protein [bacterium]